jgi:hypothetical protein
LRLRCAASERDRRRDQQDGRKAAKAWEIHLFSPWPVFFSVADQVVVSYCPEAEVRRFLRQALLRTSASKGH